jgi:hypothetical protein
MTGHDLDLDAIKRRTEAATPGPWQELATDWNDNGFMVSGYVARLRDDGRVDDITGDGLPLADAEFIAHARTDIPALVAEIESLRAKLAAAEQDEPRCTGSWETCQVHVPEPKREQS